MGISPRYVHRKAKNRFAARRYTPRARSVADTVVRRTSNSDAADGLSLTGPRRREKTRIHTGGPAAFCPAGPRSRRHCAPAKQSPASGSPGTGRCNNPDTRSPGNVGPRDKVIGSPHRARAWNAMNMPSGAGHAAPPGVWAGAGTSCWRCHRRCGLPANSRWATAWPKRCSTSASAWVRHGGR